MTGHPPPVGRLPASAIHERPGEPIPQAEIDAYLALPDLTGNVSDAIDILGDVGGAVGAATLRPLIREARIAGPALTVLNRDREDPVRDIVAAKDNRLGDIEAHNIALPGDVLVVQGSARASSLGGIMATIAKRQGEAAIIVDGLVRDAAASRSIGLPVWARGTTPRTGKWRVETVGVNLPVDICGVPVKPGDLVVADENGICFVRRHAVEAVLAEAQRITADEARRLALISDGMPLARFGGAAKSDKGS